MAQRSCGAGKCLHKLLNIEVFFVPKLPHFGSYFLPVMARYDVPIG